MMMTPGELTTEFNSINHRYRKLGEKWMISGYRMGDLDLVEKMRVLQQLNHVGQVRAHAVHCSAAQLLGVRRTRTRSQQLARVQLRRQQQRAPVPWKPIASVGTSPQPHGRIRVVSGTK
jgi:hypothetical protein